MNNISQRSPRPGYIDPNFPNPGKSWDTPIIIYGYTPNFALALFSVIWFFLILIWQSTLTIRHRSWWFVTFSIGLVFEVIGYIARLLSAKKDPYHLIYFILNYFFIVTAPVFLAAGIYTILSALISRLGSKYTILPPKLVLWFFIASDVIATITQIIGASLIAKLESDRKDPTFANNILLGGLAYQVFSMGVYVIVTGIFLLRARRVIQRSNLTLFSIVFTLATLLIYLRTVFRLSETADGIYGKLSTNEIYFACLEFMPVALAVLLLTVWHPARCVGRRVRPTEEEKQRFT